MVEESIPLGSKRYIAPVQHRKETNSNRKLCTKRQDIYKQLKLHDFSDERGIYSTSTVPNSDIGSRKWSLGRVITKTVP